MSKWIRIFAGVFFGLILSRPALAALPLPQGLKYQQKLFEFTKKNLGADRFDKGFKSNGFEIIEFEGQTDPVYNIDWLDRTFIKKKGNGVVLLKSNVKVTEEIKDKAIYVDPYGDFLVHIKIPGTEDRYDALYFSGGFIESDISAFLKGKLLSASQSLSSEIQYRSLAMLLIESSRAESGSSLCSNNSLALRSKQVIEVGTGFVKSVVGCMKGIFAGAWNATGGAVISIARGAWEALTNPVQAFRGAKASLARMTSFVQNAGDEITKISGEFASLPSHIKSEILCELGSTLATGTFMTIASGGATAGAIGKALHGVLEKLGTRFPESAASINRMKATVADQMPGAAAKKAAAIYEQKKIRLHRLMLEKISVKIKRIKLNQEFTDLNVDFEKAVNGGYGNVVEAEQVLERINQVQKQLTELDKIELQLSAEVTDLKKVVREEDWNAKPTMDRAQANLARAQSGGTVTTIARAPVAAAETCVSLQLLEQQVREVEARAAEAKGKAPAGASPAVPPSTLPAAPTRK